VSNDITLRPVKISDADLLLAWRNDPGTRSASHNTDEVSRENHIAWLTKTLENPNRRLLIAEKSGVPVGTVRADFDDGVWELSWTTAPNARGQGVAKGMVALLAQQIPEPIRAEIKPENTPSIRVAEDAGMIFNREVDGVMHYSRAAMGSQATHKKP